MAIARDTEMTNVCSTDLGSWDIAQAGTLKRSRAAAAICDWSNKYSIIPF